MPGRRSHTRSDRESGSEVEATRKSDRLKAKPSKNYDKISKGVVDECVQSGSDSEVEVSKHDVSEEQVNSELNDSVASSSGSSGLPRLVQDGDSVSDNSEIASQDEDDNEVQLNEWLQRSKQQADKMTELEQQSQKRVQSLKRLLQEHNTLKKSKKSDKMTTAQMEREEKKREIEWLDAEIEKRVQQLSKLQQYEDDLSSLLDDGLKNTKKRLDQNSRTTVAASSLIQGGYTQVLRELLHSPVKKVSDVRSEIELHLNKILNEQSKVPRDTKRARRKLVNRSVCRSMNNDEHDKHVVGLSAQTKEGRKGKKRRSAKEVDLKSGYSSDNDTDGSSQIPKAKGKLVSGKLAKIDDVDIKVQV